MSEPKRPLSVVAIGAHPDDVEITCLGMLLRYREHLDARVTIVTASDGRAGRDALFECTPEEIVAIRRREADAVAAELGAAHISLGQRDQEVHDGPEQREALIDVLRQVRADIVLTQPPTDYHEDHCVTSRLAAHAALVATVRSIETEHPPLEKSAALYYVEPVGGFNWQPSNFVDITSVFRRKCELLALHDSQIRSIKEVYGVNLLEQVEIANRYRGFQCGVPYAEGFCAAPAWGRVRPGGLPGT